jgi:RNA polymerase sigma-70 factor (ECF subfamily)
MLADGGFQAIPRWRRWALLPARLRLHTAHEPEAAKQQANAGAGSGVNSADYDYSIHAHERPILNYLWRMTGDEQAAYDITQEVFLRAWQHFEAIRGYEQPRGWLFRVATNLALTHQRRRPAGREDELREANDPGSSDPAWRLAERDLVRDVLLRLSPKRRAALVLREVYGLTAAEIAGVLGMNGAAVRMAPHRAREQFREVYLREEDVSHGQ